MVSQYDSSKAKGSAVVAGKADEELARTLENTLAGRVLKQIAGPLDEIIHNAIKAARADTGNTEGLEDKNAAITRPASGGRCARIWDTLDKLSAEGGTVPSLKEIRKLARQKRWNKSTTTIQYYRWRNAHGITRQSARANAANEPNVTAQ